VLSFFDKWTNKQTYQCFYSITIFHRFVDEYFLRGKVILMVGGFIGIWDYRYLTNLFYEYPLWTRSDVGEETLDLQILLDKVLTHLHSPPERELVEPTFHHAIGAPAKCSQITPPIIK
jgi:hypothetical protein